jgi:hypothetical protein
VTADLTAAALAAAAELDDEAEDAAKAKPKPRHPCGFCATGDHNLCKETIRNGSQAKVAVWECPCWQAGHTLGRQPPLNRTPPRMAASAMPPRPAAVVTVDLPGTSPAGPPVRRSSRRAAPSPFPAGVVSPYGFRKALLDAGLEPASFRPQTVYTWVKQAAAGGTFPVRWYAGGAETDAGADGAKPGVPVEQALAWHRAGGAK